MAALVIAVCTNAEAIDPHEVLSRLEKTYSGITDYQCRMRITSRNGNDTEIRVNNYYFMKQRNIRMDVLKGTRFMDDGSVAVFRGGSEVTGRIGIIALSLPKTDPLVTTNRGSTFDESDMQYVICKIGSHLGSGEITVTEYGTVYEITLVYKDKTGNGGITKEVIRIDSLTLLPLTAKSYADSQLVQDVEWSNFIINAGIPVELFDVWYDPKKLSDRGIATVHGTPFAW